MNTMILMKKIIDIITIILKIIIKKVIKIKYIKKNNI